MKSTNFGILASISWNSNEWNDSATQEDLDQSSYGFVRENDWMHEDLNFGHGDFPCEEDGSYIAYTPQFNRLPSLEESKDIKIVFFKSKNYHLKKNLIIGLYAFPSLGEFYREADHEWFETYDWGNVKSQAEHIVLFKKAIEISDDIAARERLLPTGRKLGQQGFNYLTYDNVIKILDKATTLNPKDSKLQKIKFTFLKKPYGKL